MCSRAAGCGGITYVLSGAFEPRVGPEMRDSGSNEKTWLKVSPTGCGGPPPAPSSTNPDPWPRQKGLEPWAYWQYCGGVRLPVVYGGCRAGLANLL